MVETAQDFATTPRTGDSPTPPIGDRRRFVTGMGALALSALAGLTGVGRVEAAPAAAPTRREEPIRLPKETDGESEILRMQRQMQKALAKPVEQRRWGMVIDLRKCVGCSACTIACKAENRLPPGVIYRPVIEEEIGEYPNVTKRFVPRPCMQCENPPCVPVCPVGATYKRPDGIVEVNYDTCIGCRYCVTACPYQARTFDSGDHYSKGTPASQPYEHLVTYEYGKRYQREEGQSPVGNVRKCHFCLHRLNEGMLPECVTSCIGIATYFGDLNDPDSMVSELAASPNVHRLKEELGTKPRVYYLM